MGVRGRVEGDWERVCKSTLLGLERLCGRVEMVGRQVEEVRQGRKGEHDSRRSGRGWRRQGRLGGCGA